jgi:di/tricarboxylate transporter
MSWSLNDEAAMTEGMLIVFAVLAGAVALFAWGRPRSDVVAILVVLALNLTGVLTIQESLAGFGDPVVILIAAVSIVGEGLIATGVAYRLGEAVMRAGGNSEARLVALVMLLAGRIGAFMSSSAIVAMFIPVVMGIANRIGLNPKRMLMPLSVAALISGMMTLIASSPNLIVDNTLRARGLAPLGFFGWTPFGVVILVVAIIFMLVFGRNMLSRRLTAEDRGPGQPGAFDLAASYGLANKWHRLQVPGGSPLIGQAVAQVQLLEQFGVVVIGFEKHRHGKSQYLPAMPATMFEPNDGIFLMGSEEQTQRLMASQGLLELPRLNQRQRHEAFQELGAAEIMLAPESKLIGATLREVGFRSQYDLDVLAIRHRGEPLTTNLDDQTLDFGDTLLVAGGWAKIRPLRDDRENFFVLTLPAVFEELMPARRRAPIAVGILVAMVLVMAFELIPNTAAVLIAALALIASGCVKLEAIYRIVNWKTVVLIAGTLPLATALAKTGATAMMATGMVAALGSLGPLAVLATVFLITSLVGLFISNSATAVLMAPVAIDAARALHDSPQAFAMTVALGCCAAYVTPVSSAVNMLVMEPGKYTFGDYVKLGVPLLLLTLLISVALVSAIYR